MSTWSPDSWQTKPALQQPTYPSPEDLNRALSELAKLPPLVSPWEVANLKSQLADAAAGKRFLLQGGDCAESFAGCNADTLTNKLKIMLQMSLVLVQGSKRPVIRVGRFAGHWAERGFPLSTASAEYVAYSHELILGRHPESWAALHHADGSPLREGELVAREIG